MEVTLFMNFPEKAVCRSSSCRPIELSDDSCHVVGAEFVKMFF